jgi:galactosylceramidase
MLLPVLLLLGAAAGVPAAPLAGRDSPILLDAATAHHVFDGIGALSAGATSRLLYEYAEPHRSNILDLLFKPATAAALHILKVEIGGDSQSTDGSEPSHMHTRDDLSCARGYETWLIAEAKRRNPAIITYGLSWATPRWVGDGQGNGTGFYSADNWLYHTKWLECVYNATGGVKVDWMGTWNEKPPAPVDYVVGLRAALDAAGFAGTQLSLFDGDYSTNNLVAAALASPAFNASFSSVGRHYPCDAPFPAIEASIHKAYWSSEDFSLPNSWTGASCWGRLLNQNYAYMNITATIAWSLAWTAPRGLPFAGSGLMTAQQPWSGHYSGGDGTGGPSAAPSLNGPLWTTAHTTQFAAPGWRYLLVSGGGSGLLPAALGNGSYVTLVSPSGADFALVIEKYAGPCKCKPGGAAAGVAPATLRFATGGGLPGPGAALEVWRSNATAQFWRDSDALIASDGTFTVSVPADSAVTVSSVRGRAAHGGVAPAAIPPPAPFPLPHVDDFSGYAPDASPVRGWADQQGSWAARGGALAQVVPLDPGANRWTREDVDPLTLLGDPDLANVTVAVTAAFEAPTAPSGQGSGALGYVYAQVCARVSNYTGFKNGPPPGLCLGLNASGAWVVRAGGVALGSGVVAGGGGGFDPAQPRALVLQAVGQRVLAWVGSSTSGAPVLNATSSAYQAGLVALGSGFHSARFYNFSLRAAE